jgi:putative transposase
VPAWPQSLTNKPSTYTSLHYHVIFSTKNREAIIEPSCRDQPQDCLGGTVRGLGGFSQGVGGVADHVHLLFALRATHCLADFMRELKKASSIWVTDSTPQKRFRWQEGYAAFFVSSSGRGAVQEYIARQEEHHRHKTFREEIIEFLTKSGVDFDERYLD